MDKKKILGAINWILFPIKIIIQPFVPKIPFLTSNEDIRIEKALQMMKGYCLDIGCRNNNLIKRYRARKGKGLGIDVYDWGTQDILVEDTANLSFNDETFDTVTMLACINHIPNREDVLKEVHRILKPEGRLVVTNLTPFLSKVWHKYVFWDQDEHVRGMKDGEVYGLSTPHFLKIINDAGFFVKKRQSFSWGLNKVYLCKKKSSSNKPGVHG